MRIITHKTCDQSLSTDTHRAAGRTRSASSTSSSTKPQVHFKLPSSVLQTHIQLLVSYSLTAHLSSFNELGEHDHRCDPMLVDHPPEVPDGIYHGTLGCNVCIWPAVTLDNHRNMLFCSHDSHMTAYINVWCVDVIWSFHAFYRLDLDSRKIIW